MPNDLKERIRKDYISGGGIFGQFIYPYAEEIKKSKFFLDTMEEFVISSERREIDAQKERTNDLTPEQLDEYWQWHYPVHWQEIFANRIRTSFIMQICSFVEGELNEIAERVRVISGAPIKLRDLTGSTLSKPKKFIEAFGRFTTPEAGSWEIMERIFDVRNVMVHEAGYSGGYRSHKEIVKFASFVTGLSFSNDHIKVEREFCDYCLNAASDFVTSLHSAYDSFRATASALENMKAQ